MWILLEVSPAQIVPGHSLSGNRSTRHGTEVLYRSANRMIRRPLRQVSKQASRGRIHKATRRLQNLVEERRKLADEKTEQTNRLTSHLKIYIPQMLDWFERLDTELVCALLERWPTLGELQKVPPAKLRSFFRKHHCRDQELVERRIIAIRQAIPAIRDRAVVEAKSMVVKVIVQLVRSLIEGIAGLDERIGEAAAAHPDFFIFESLPGAGHGAGLRIDPGESRAIREESRCGTVSGIGTEAGGLRGKPAAIRNQQSRGHDGAPAIGGERAAHLGAVRTRHGPTTVWVAALRARWKECEEESGGSGGTKAGRLTAPAVGERRGV